MDSLRPDFVFPVNKLVSKNGGKIVSKKSLMISNGYSEAVAFENFLKDQIFFFTSKDHCPGHHLFIIA
jgi:hypothetical protein